ncbi:hypothetical protein QE152_g13121 [Popillia japonica]|uniref:Uncharacterized protein n=1 Tax=Popillia japonica TaxID=7064 RepID=A0AAW1LFH3_POPJA
MQIFLIVILPPDNANNENTDEDSDDDEHISINNLPADQLRAEAEVLVHENNESDSEDDIPLSILIKRRRRYSNCQQLVWMKSDITTTMPL